MPTDRLSSLGELLTTDADLPLDDLRHASRRTMSAVSFSLAVAAENLLIKALRAARSGDLDRARAYVTRALRLDFDEHERVHPARQQAQMLLFNAVTDALEDSQEGDHRWLDAALAVLPDCEEHARAEFLGVLNAVDQDWDVEPDESRRIRTTLGHPAPALELQDTRSVPEAEYVQVILQVLTAASAYLDVLEENA